PDALAARDLTVSDVLDAARQAGGVRGAGFLENDRQRLTLRTEGQIRSAEHLGQTVITSAGGQPVRLRDVAAVVEGRAPKYGDGAIDGKPGVVVVVSRQLEGDTYSVTAQVEAELERMRPLLEKEGIVYHPRLFRQADFIETAVGNVTHSLIIGAVLVA